MDELRGQIADELLPRLQDTLFVGERVLWVGRPNPRLLWSERGREVIIGTILLVVAGLALFPVFYGNRENQAAGLAWAAIATVPGFLGVYGVTATWRIRRKARLHTVYAVTDRRAIIFHAIAPGHGTLSRQDYEFGPDELVDYTAKDHDLILGRRWSGWGKYRQLLPIGFLGLNDPGAARSALDRLIQAHVADTGTER